MLAVKLTNEGSDCVFECLLAGIVEIEVEVEKMPFSRRCLEIVDNRRAKNRLSTPRDAMKPHKRVLPSLPFLEKVPLQEPESCAFLTLR